MSHLFGFKHMCQRKLLWKRLNSTLIPVSQGGSVYLDLSAADFSLIDITAAWQDHCDVIESSSNVQVSVDSATNSCSFKVVETSRENISIVKLKVPEIIDVFIKSNDLQLQMQNKILGDISVACKSGSVSIDKLRGEHISFDCGAADIRVKKLIEGTSKIRSRTLNAKMINGEDVDIACEDNLLVEAMYAKKSSIVSNGNINMGLLKGTTKVVSEKGSIFMEGIDGNFDVVAKKGNISLQINKLLRNSKSIADARKGSVQARIDPEVVAKLVTNMPIGSRARITIISDSFQVQAEGDANQSGISGLLTGRGQQTQQNGEQMGARSGKIDLFGAAEQSLESRSTESFPKTVDENNSEGSSEVNNCYYPSVMINANGHIRVETLSWMENIRRKYLGDSSEASSVNVGRTASANRRASDLLKSSTPQTSTTSDTDIA